MRARLLGSLERLRGESLQRLLEGVAVVLLSRLSSRRLAAEAAPVAGTVTGSVSVPLLREFLRHLADGRPFEDRAENQRWLRSAAAAGLDVRRWLRGFSAEVQGIRFATERDPLQVLQMGQWFDTCLALDGFNAHSVLVNAMDVNKQVIVGRDAGGRSVARKLIGATARGELAGYRAAVPAERLARVSDWIPSTRHAAEAWLRRTGGEPEPTGLLAALPLRLLIPLVEGWEAADLLRADDPGACRQAAAEWLRPDVLRGCLVASSQGWPVWTRRAEGMDRWRDWQRQSEGDRSAALALKNAGNWDWCCFACHQSAEKALKAALEHLRREHSGHSLNYLLRALEEDGEPASRQVRDACARLNRFYIPTRYPDAFDQGAPVEQYTESDADAALLDLEHVLEHARAALRQTED